MANVQLHSSGYTEDAVSRWHNETDEVYRKFWGETDHWGDWETFDEIRRDCLRWRQAAQRSSEQLLLLAGGLTAQDRVLDVGCGRGATALWLAARTGCEVTGVDLSQVKIAAARQATMPGLRCDWHVGSATALPVEDKTFSCAWSQAALYQVSDRLQALGEIRRALREGAHFVFDDLTTPCAPWEISPESMESVYNRLLFTPTWSMEEYCDKLGEAGFDVRHAEDLTSHLRHSYAVLERLAAPVDSKLAQAYVRMVRAIDDGHLGWARWLAVPEGF